MKDDTANKIKCPKCGHEFPVGDAFLIQAEEKIKLVYQQKINEQAEGFNSQKLKLEHEREEFELLKKQQDSIINTKLQERLSEEMVKIKQLTDEEYKQKITLLEDENDKKKKENFELKSRELQLLKNEKALKEKQEEMQLDIERQMLVKREEIATEVIKKEQEKNALKFKEYDKQLSDQKQLIEEMKRKAEQGSMQMQGEVQELALEDILKSLYRFDLIESVPKGVRGADVIHTIVNPLQQICGKIIYESKRTKAFTDNWIEKLKEDQREQQAELAVIVTEVYPKGITHFARKDGVWICSYQEVESITFVLRELLLQTHSVKSAQENKGDKMEVLYTYLTSEEFRHRVEAIVDGFSEMKTEMDKEKRAMERIWKEREKQLEKVIHNTIDMYGSIKGIAGNAVGTIKALELGE
jgi:hypothetical protein